LDFDLEYSFGENGFGVKLRYGVPKRIDTLPRAGIYFALGKKFADFEYYGYGAGECYCDTARYFEKGFYAAKVDGVMPAYIVPQECAHRHGAEFLRLIGGKERVTVSGKTEFSFNVLPFDTDTLYKTKHNWELPKSKYAHVYIDAAMRGIGSNSCGPRLDPMFEIPKAGVLDITVIL
jgi:beta-galactosidase